MSHFATAEELQAELGAFLREFVGSETGRRAADAAREAGLTGPLVLRTVNPAAAVWLDVSEGRVEAAPDGEPVVELELEADDLHDLLLNRLGPVEISQLYETDRVRFAGPPEALGALAILAGQLQPFYPESLARRGRQDLLDTPARPTRTLWDVDGPPREVIGKRRPWQRPKRTAEAV